MKKKNIYIILIVLTMIVMIDILSLYFIYIGKEVSLSTGIVKPNTKTTEIKEESTNEETKKEDNQSPTDTPKETITKKVETSKKTNQTKVENAGNNQQITETPEEPVTVEKSKEQINDELRKSIQTKYGVTIKYGEEMGDYKLKGKLPTKLTDPDEINENLKNIKTHIAYYPVGFFKEMKNYDMPLTIYLVKNIPGSGIVGIADKEFYSDIKITICTDQFFFRVFHHEVYHYIEAYMETKGYNNSIFKNWDSLNPEGFSYGKTNSNYSYSLVDNDKIAYFINNYGQTNEREDRATIFEDLMARAYEPKNSYIESNNIWTKGKMISEEIDRYFKTVTSSKTERWERFIYN